MSALLTQIMRDAPVGYWPLDETSGTTAYDRSGNGRSGTYTGTITPAGRSTILGVAPFFNGGYVDIPSNAAFSAGAGLTGKMSIEAWVYVDAIGASVDQHIIFSKGGSSLYEWTMGILNSSSWSTTPAYYAGTHDLTTGNTVMTTPNSTDVLSTDTVARLHHLVCTYDRSVPHQSMYVDGVLRITNTTLEVGDHMTAGSANVQIGHRADGAGSSYVGSIQHVAYYGAELSATRVKAHYQAGIRSGVMVG